ncbi:MAG: pentapeptide repeat-containing protein [Xenococcus sp. (in: cyanobacteria)]
MANPEHLAKLQEGVKSWNQWRQENPHIKPNLTNYNLFFEHHLRGYRANFTGINLRDAYLNSVNLRDSYLNEANLVGADLSGSYLRDANLDGANLSGANLSGANFLRADLSGANLSDTNLYRTRLLRANLVGANLSGSYLRSLEALGTNFEGATLTGACIEDWNINSQTNFQNVNCDYIYLKIISSKEEKRRFYSDRRPHDPDQTFAPGEFTKLFEQALETVDLIFSNGMDWKAFFISFQKLQVEYANNELSIHSFENKGNGVFAIKVNVPSSTDKAEIEKYLKKQYQLEATVEAQQRELTNLYEITKLLAGKPININTGDRTIELEKGNYNEQIEGNYSH